VPGSVVEVRRGGAVESLHAVHVAVADRSGALQAFSGDASLVTFARSAVKPLQALPLVDDGVLQRFGFGVEELALACASHSGQPEHVAVVRRMLAALGEAEDALACGAHAPFHRPSAKALREAGVAPGRAHNNCSGKHAGMMALAKSHGWSVAGYHEASHPVQQRMLRELSVWCDVPASSIPMGVDGCGVATFAVPLRALAGAFGRLGAAAAAGDRAPARVQGAMAAAPHLVAGSDRLCTALMEVTGGRLLAKVGAEGVYGAVVPERGLGIALKVADGAKRAAEPALVGVLHALDVLTSAEVDALARYARPTVENTRGEVVGEVEARMALERAM
jgi:L-asparaginase II